MAETIDDLELEIQKSVREIVEPYLGQPNTYELTNQIRSEILKQLEKFREQGLLPPEFDVVADPDDPNLMHIKMPFPVMWLEGLYAELQEDE